MGLAAVWKLCAEAAGDPSGGGTGLGWLESGTQGTGQEPTRAAVNLTREGEDCISLYPLSRITLRAFVGTLPGRDGSLNGPWEK